jgi:uncharacterized protein (TIGR02453 family)
MNPLTRAGRASQPAPPAARGRVGWLEVLEVKRLKFVGWADEALAFYEGLEADNSKAFWQANKQDYEESVRAPMEALLAELAPRWGDGRMFRPYRDIRFSADKTPYKTHIGAVLGNCYVQFSADGLAAGCGMWEMAPDQLDRYRQAVADDRSGKQLARAVSKLGPAGIEVIAQQTLKTAPRGYPKDHPRIELLRYRGLATWQSWPPGAWLASAKAKERLVAFFEASQPVSKWLDANVGASTLPRTAR